MVKINSKDLKPTPVDNDILLILDSEVLVGGNPTVKKFTYKNLVDSLSFELMKFLIPYMRYTYVVDENNIPVVDENGDFIIDIDIANKPINTNSFSVPIEFPEDYVSPPEPSELYENFSKKVRIRKFKHTSNDDVVFDWATPHDMDTTQPIQFRVKGIKTEANGGEGEESWSVKFGMAGYASRDLELSEQPSFGTPQTVTKDIGSGAIPQHSVYITNWSADLTVSNISNDSINQFWFYRDTAIANNYVHSIAVIEIEIKYTKR